MTEWLDLLSELVDASVTLEQCDSGKYQIFKRSGHDTSRLSPQCYTAEAAIIKAAYYHGKGEQPKYDG